MRKKTFQLHVYTYMLSVFYRTYFENILKPNFYRKRREYKQQLTYPVMGCLRHKYTEHKTKYM